MVKVREEQPTLDDGSIDVDEWLGRLALSSTADSDQLRSACALAYRCTANASTWSETTSTFSIGLEMAEILADLHVDIDGLIAAVLYRAVRENKLSLAEVKTAFGADVVKLIEGVLGMAAISSSRNAIGHDKKVLGQPEEQRENIRKMLVALVDDVRVALIKLAERTCAIRAVKNNPERRYRVAREVFDLYAPLAHRLGIGHLKWELEDLSFRYLEPNTYKKIAKLLAEKRLARQTYIEDVKSELRQALQQNGIAAELSGRVKHIYSIWRKMHKKGIGFSQVYDIRAVRILVPDIKDCYAVLGIVHGLWRNIQNEFDDYIANPKDNGYRSLHTAVIGPQGKVLEIQVRTFDMHEEAEYGVCAHWRYKGTDNNQKGNSDYEEKLHWLRQVLEWHEETGETEFITESIDQIQDRVYVFTPEGHVVNLALGATPLDFAYHIHTEVGHRCRGAKVNGRIVPLTYQLHTGEQIEVLTAKESNPKRDWLQSDLGYIKTPRARYKVQQWFRQQARSENSDAGRALLDKLFKRLALNALDYKAIAKKLGFSTVDDLYVAAGSGELSAAQVLKAAQSLAIGETAKKVERPVNRLSPQTKRQAFPVSIHGVGNLLTRIAGCCRPVPGDDIAGYVTMGRGVSIHLRDCPKFLRLAQKDSRRVLQVSWADENDQQYEVEIAIRAFDRSGLLKDVTTLLTQEKVNISAVTTKTDPGDHSVTMSLSIAIAGLEQLDILINKLSQLPNIFDVERVREASE